ncbi:MAG: cell wall-active antibiotics response protein, partial [Leadbetterella sp.]|nr:cell wall-active antibiotics response protein [Leadbetterella sp.]
RLIPLIIGINALLRKDYINGIIAITVAVIFYIPDFLTAAEKTQYYKLWPLLLVGVGLTILAKYMFPSQFESYSTRVETEDRTYVNESNIMAGSSSKFITKNFTGGKINCVMGGSEINLTEADLQSHSTLRVFILMGGMEMRIPKEWNVKLDVFPIMGGVEDRITKFPENVVDKNKVLVISGYVIMGGIEIKRV